MGEFDGKEEHKTGERGKTAVKRLQDLGTRSMERGSPLEVPDEDPPVCSPGPPVQLRYARTAQHEARPTSGNGLAAPDAARRQDHNVIVSA